jgi:hypothetical protein
MWYGKFGLVWLNFKFIVWLFEYHPRVPAYLFVFCIGVPMRERSVGAGDGPPNYT